MIKTIEQIDKEFKIFTQEIREKTKLNTKNIEKAYNLSKKAHEKQFRQSGEPYIVHPFEVAKIVFQFGLDESSIIAALLHDVVEDTEYNLEKIKEIFGEEVEVIVDGLTKMITIMSSKEEKKIETLRKILLASAKDLRVLIIKLCDRLHNIRTLENVSIEKQERIASETIQIYVPIAQKIGMYSLKWELEDLSFKYQNPEMYQFIKKEIGLKRTDRENIVNKSVEEFKNTLKKENKFKNILIFGRAKSFYSIYKKLKNKDIQISSIYDLYAIRIIVKEISDCYIVLGLLHKNFKMMPDRLKDYIANPKFNGYQSLHTTLFSKEINGPVEVQIRTEEMHRAAELGVAAHWKYKDMKKDKRFEKKISWLREVMQWEKEHQDNLEFLNLLKYDFFQDEIYVFTPKKDLIFLPEGSSIIDFGYAIHTDIGNHIYKAKVNGNHCNFDRILKNGDTVEIITNKNVKPNEKWLKYVKTSKARLKIRAKLQTKLSSSTKKEKIEELTINALKEKLTRVDEFKKSRKAGCCKIEIGEQVIGLVGKGRELILHNASCDNAKHALNEKIPINWKETKSDKIEINLELKDRYGIISDILDIVSKFNLNISKMNTKVNKNGVAKIDFIIINGPFIDKLINKLQKIQGIIYVRTNENKK